MANQDMWSLVELTKTLNETAQTDRDNLIPIDGPTGSGKSTLGIELCIKGCPWFDMENDILYSRQELMDWISNARPGSWALADEAVNILFKRDFASKAQKFLLKILDMCRDRNLTIFMCIPNFWALDKHILEGRVRLRIYIAKTGLAFLWKPSGNPFTPDKWYRKYNEKVCYNWDSYPNAKRTKGFTGYLKFGDLPDKYKEKYIKIKKTKKEMIKKLEEQEENQEEINKKRSIELGKLIMLSTLRDNNLLKNGALIALAEIEGVSKQVINQRLKFFKDKYGELISEVNIVNSNTIYNDITNNENLEENST
jgi:hypothetical protein